MTTKFVGSRMQSKPIFNKRLYKAHAGITISKQANEILHRDPNRPRSENELRAIRSVIAGLKEIHRNFEFVKTALGHAVTYEKHESDARIEKLDNETQMSCYYILNGSVEAFYTVKNSTPFQKSEERSISYTHVAGDYIGLLSADGPNFDIPPPDSMSTIEHSEFLRIDTVVFHEKIWEAQKLFQDEIARFLDGNVLFGKITKEDKEKLVSQMVKQEFPAGKQILSQGQKQEHAFFVAKGRCSYFRRLYLPEQKRSELFKLGYIEKGSYFDASCIIDDQNSKFSVSAVGPVTCYTLNKWTIKNSESLLRALSANRPTHPIDKEIESLIKESDQWQSYKRDTVCEAFAFKRKTKARIIPQHDIPKPLDIAIRRGAALRQQRKKELITSSTDDLDPSLRKSSGFSQEIDEATEGDNAKSLLKAVLLMKRSRAGSIQTDGKNVELKSSSSTDQKNENKPGSSLKQREIKSAPHLKQRTPSHLKNQQKATHKERLNRNKQKSPKCTQNRSTLFKINQKNQNIANRNVSPSNRSSPIEQKNRENPPKTLNEKHNASSQLKTKTEDRRSSSPTPYAHAPYKKLRSEMNDSWVANDRRFKVKEIMNTRIPGKEIPVDAYRRFEPSMFDYLDRMNDFEHEKKVDPFAAKLKARAWLKYAKERLAAGGSEYNPGQSPIIVIEEFCNDDWESQEEIGFESRDEREDKIKISSGSLETLLEDSDKENAAQEVKPYKWTTAVHETRYEAERCLEQAKTDIAILERQLVKLGWTRDMLNEKERKRNERRKRSSKNKEQSIEEKIDPDETEKKLRHETKRKFEKVKNRSENLQEGLIERRRTRTLKRQDSIQKILQDHSKRFDRRNRSYSDEIPVEIRPPALIKRYSSDAVVSSDDREGSTTKPRTLKPRTFTIS